MVMDLQDVNATLEDAVARSQIKLFGSSSKPLGVDPGPSRVHSGSDDEDEDEVSDNEEEDSEDEGSEEEGGWGSESEEDFGDREDNEEDEVNGGQKEMVALLGWG